MEFKEYTDPLTEDYDITSSKELEEEQKNIVLEEDEDIEIDLNDGSIDGGYILVEDPEASFDLNDESMDYESEILKEDEDIDLNDLSATFDLPILGVVENANLAKNLNDLSNKDIDKLEEMPYDVPFTKEPNPLGDSDDISFENPEFEDESRYNKAFAEDFELVDLSDKKQK